ncbi:hypothetical protein F2P45_31280 [Massilia sp. CCM 8733]|uniref:Uncharacterized protein n=1 Tax=Massilia mucilaginosa TaxID=2609282 RepID=A0ABX0P2C2_9BURK|nr:hypothetical protein [Massilia mucilaginosa]NHZ93453.1 hypothetical protein [Massilia mucilaginosa]
MKNYDTRHSTMTTGIWTTSWILPFLKIWHAGETGSGFTQGQEQGAQAAERSTSHRAPEAGICSASGTALVDLRCLREPHQLGRICQSCARIWPPSRA